MTNYNFEVETKQCGQLRPYADSIYHFIITDKSEKPHREWTVKQFCTQFLHKGYEKDKMPTPFSGEIMTFKKLTAGVWEYKVREEYTG